MLYTLNELMSFLYFLGQLQEARFFFLSHDGKLQEPAKDAVTCWGTWSANQHHSYFPLDVPCRKVSAEGRRVADSPRGHGTYGAGTRGSPKSLTAIGLDL